jgi:hypothetical protein
MSFELFDEVERTDAGIQGKWPEIAAWTAEMAVYIRSIDPYDHMITTSSDLKHPELWKPLDYYQPHLFSASAPATLIGSTQLPPDKPAFYGEIGDLTTMRGTREDLRNALYTSLLANTGGLPMYWDWNEVVAAGLYPELAAAAKVVKDSDIGHHPIAAKLSLSVNGCGARGIGSSGCSLMRVLPTGSGPFSVQIGGLTVIQGSSTVEVINLDTGKSTTQDVTITNARISIDLPGEDCIVIVTAKP